MFYTWDRKTDVITKADRIADTPLRERVVAAWNNHGVLVSTVFLEIDHSFLGPPLLFETMVFRGRCDGYQRRYHTSKDPALATRG